MAVYEALLLNTAIPQIQAAQAGDSYVMVVNATTPALRITQTGTGDSILVEDAANPDSTPFVVTAAGDVGIGTTSPGYKLEVNGVGGVNTSNANAAEFHVKNTSARDWVLLSTGSAWAGGGQTGYFNIYDNTAGQQRLTIDTSGNLGIGATSPGAKLEVAVSGSSQQLRLVSTGNSIFRTRWIDATAGFAMESNNTTETAYYPFTLTGSVFRFNTGAGSFAATLDASGNLGLGVVPSAWSNYKAFQVGYTGSFSNHVNLNYLRVESNSFNGGSGETYLQDGFATKYAQNNGAGIHAWYTAPSGTAGNAISFTQAMTLDADGDLGIGTTSPNAKLHILAADATTADLARFQQTNQGNLLIQSQQGSQNIGSANGILFSNATGNMGWRTGASSGDANMLLNASGNLGIGTTSPSSKLEVANTSGNVAATLRSSNSGYSELYFADVADNAAGALSYEHSTNLLRFYNGGSVRATLDASGNLGLGVTPSAWGSSYKALQIPSGALAAFGTSVVSLYQNSYDSGTGAFKYVNSLFAAKYDINQGSHYWYLAPSGTAGDPITFIQAMTLDASGNLGVGATSPNNKLTVQADATGASFADNGVAQIIARGDTDSTKRLGLGIDTTNNIGVIQAQKFGTGTYPLAINPAGGQVLVGTTTSIGVGGLTTIPNNSAGAPSVLWNRTATASTSTAVQFRDGGTAVGEITYTNTATAYVTSSDYRLKNTIAPMTGALAKVAALKPVTYKWKADGSDGEGFIAHELQAVVPQCVTGEKDAVDAEGKPIYQGIDTSFLVATLTAAIQEQQAMINELKAEVAALKGA